MNAHIIYLLTYLATRPGRGGLLIHPEDLSGELNTVLDSWGTPPKRITRNQIDLANGSSLRLSNGDERSYKSSTYYIVYIHERIDSQQLRNLEASIPKGGLMMSRSW